MKKIGIVLVLALILATGTAFADHPAGLGVGIVGGWYGNWSGGGYGQYGLSLKVPVIPVFWGINLHIKDGFFSLGITGDKYIFDSALVKNINLSWYLGVGLWGGITISDNLSFSAGARVPIGLSWQPIKLLEVFLDIAPSLGISIINPFEFPVGGLPVELGIRLWL